MNNSNTPKIVIGVGLVALYAVGFTVFALRGKHDNVVAQNPPAAVSEQAAVDAPSPSTAIPESANNPASTDAGTAAAMSAPVAPAISNAAQSPDVTRPAVASQPKPRAQEVPIDSMPSPRPPVASDGEQSSRSNSGSNTVSEFATAETAPAESVTSADETAAEEDSQSTQAPAVDNEAQ
jgi:hypothetical protein